MLELLVLCMTCISIAILRIFPYEVAQSKGECEVTTVQLDLFIYGNLFLLHNTYVDIRLINGLNQSIIFMHDRFIIAYPIENARGLHLWHHITPPHPAYSQ